MTATPAESQRDMHLRIVRRLGREVAAGAPVLDFGCGAGQTVEAYLKIARKLRQLPRAKLTVSVVGRDELKNVRARSVRLKLKR